MLKIKSSIIKYNLLISIHTNIHKKLSINECARMILSLKWSYMTLDDLWSDTSLLKKLRLHNVDNLKFFKKDYALNIKYIAEKHYLKFLR